MFRKVKDTKLYKRIERKRFALDEFHYAKTELLKQLDRVRTQMKRVKETEGKLEVETFPDIAKGWEELAELERNTLERDVEKLVECFEDYEVWNLRSKQAIHTYTVI